MERILAIIMAVSMALAISACGSNNEVTQGTASVDENGNMIVGTTIDGAGDEVDMKAVEGEKLSEVKTEAKTESKIGDYTVTIEDAKVIDKDGEKLVVVSYTFKNKSGEPVAFDNVMVSDAKQGTNELVGAVVTGVEGINILSGVEIIESGKSTNVQKVYKLANEAEAVNISVYKYGAAEEGFIEKTFNLK